MSKTEDERRNYFRIRYPQTGRPSVWLGTHHFYLAELSEKGCRMITVESLPEGQHVELVLRLYSGAVRNITGRVARGEKMELVLEELEGISFADILHEQRAILRDYPGRLRP